MRPLDTQFISLRQAATKAGYHQDYLAFLCRTGQLAATKIGRNWATTWEAVDEFLSGKARDSQARQERTDATNALQPPGTDNAENAPERAVSHKADKNTTPTQNPPI